MTRPTAIGCASPLPAGIAHWRRSKALCRLVVAAVIAIASSAAAQTPRPDQQPSAVSAPPAAQQTTPPAAKPAHDAAPRLSKFEARRIRQACRERANEHGAKGAEREAFLSKCYFGRVSHRGQRRECAQQAAAKGITDKGAVRDFVRECVKDRTK
jgi:hypothetical protein